MTCKDCKYWIDNKCTFNEKHPDSIIQVIGTSNEDDFCALLAPKEVTNGNETTS